MTGAFYNPTKWADHNYQDNQQRYKWRTEYRLCHLNRLLYECIHIHFMIAIRPRSSLNAVATTKMTPMVFPTNGADHLGLLAETEKTPTL
jgi:hypothetical protein